METLRLAMEKKQSPHSVPTLRKAFYACADFSCVEMTKTKLAVVIFNSR